jgi:hypothetical protein
MRTPRPADDRVRQVQRVLHVARRMIGRHVQGLEVVDVVLDLRPFQYFVAHAGEDVLDLLPHLHQRVHAAHRALARRQRDVHRAGRRTGGSQGGTAVLERSFDFALEGVDLRAEGPPVLGGERRQRFQEGGD